MTTRWILLVVCTAAILACGKPTPAPEPAADPNSAAAPLPTGASATDHAAVSAALRDTPPAPAALADDATPVELAALLTETALQGARYKPLRDEKHPDRRIYGLVVPGNAPASLAEVLQLVKVWRSRFSVSTQGLAVLWEGNRRRAFCTWDDEAGGLRASASAWDARVQDPADYVVSALPGFETTVNYGAGAMYDARCSATVKNLSATPIDLEVGCGYKILKGSDFAKKLQKQNVGRLAPGATKKYVVKVGKGNDLPSSDGLHLYSAGRELHYFNQYAWDDAQDYAAAVDQAVGERGGKPLMIGDFNDFTMPSGGHNPYYTFDIPGFATMNPAARDAAAIAIHKAMAAHNKKFHGAGMLILAARDADQRWRLSNTGATADD
ncbi:MAG: hypothetical protein HY902_04535 [Deltaproteobacteria bacterium]|nr:hypothetical protein [Deltaproteobacteria bacterium]